MATPVSHQSAQAALPHVLCEGNAQKLQPSLRSFAKHELHRKKDCPHWARRQPDTLLSRTLLRGFSVLAWAQQQPCWAATRGAVNSKAAANRIARSARMQACRSDVRAAGARSSIDDRAQLTEHRGGGLCGACFPWCKQEHGATNLRAFFFRALHDYRRVTTRSRVEQREWWRDEACHTRRRQWRRGPV